MIHFANHCTSTRAQTNVKDSIIIIIDSDKGKFVWSTVLIGSAGVCFDLTERARAICTQRRVSRIGIQSFD